MTDDELKKYFEEKYLKNTCFNTLEELLKDKTNIYINGYRAIIAIELKGIWRGLNDKGMISPTTR